MRANGQYEPGDNILPVLPRLEANILQEPNSGCWLWMGTCGSHGSFLVGRKGSQTNGAKLIEGQVKEIKALKGFATCRAVAARYCVSYTTILAIWNGKAWTHV